MNPFLKAVGGKRWLAAPPSDWQGPKLVDEIMAISPELYVEPMVGGGAVALALPVSLSKLVADTNPAFIVAWLGLQLIQPELLMLEMTRVQRAYPDSAFGYTKAREELWEYQRHYAVRSLEEFTHPQDWTPPVRYVALTLYINFRCFNGLWRVNSSGLMNTPWGRYKSPRRFMLDELNVYQAILAKTTAVRLDFRKVFSYLLAAIPRAIRPRIAVYADPPYAGTFGGYTAEGFDEVDQRDLSMWLYHLTQLGMHVWSTNADTPLIREIYSWARVEELLEHHSVGAKPDRRGQRRCLLIRGGQGISR